MQVLRLCDIVSPHGTCIGYEIFLLMVANILYKQAELVDDNASIVFLHPVLHHIVYTKCLALFKPQGKFLLPNFHLEKTSSHSEETFSIEDLKESLTCFRDELQFMFFPPDYSTDTNLP